MSRAIMMYYFSEVEAVAGLSHSSRLDGMFSLFEIGGSTVHGDPLFYNVTLAASRW